MVAISISVPFLVGVHSQYSKTHLMQVFIDIRCSLFVFCVLFSIRIMFFCNKCQQVAPKEARKETEKHPDGGCPISRNNVIWCFLYKSYILLFGAYSGSTLFYSAFRTTSEQLAARRYLKWTNILPRKCVIF